MNLSFLSYTSLFILSSGNCEEQISDLLLAWHCTVSVSVFLHCEITTLTPPEVHLAWLVTVRKPYSIDAYVACRIVVVAKCEPTPNVAMLKYAASIFHVAAAVLLCGYVALFFKKNLADAFSAIAHLLRCLFF